MSSDDDKCFQCQETAHMVCYCPHIRCFDCDNYGHVAADYPNKIPPSGIPARYRDNNMPQKLKHIPLLPRCTTPQILIMQEVFPEIRVDSGHTHPANTITKPPKDHLPAQIKHPGIPKTGNTSKSPLMTCPQSTIALMNRTAIQRMI